jgi:8-oxo-dGTP pyrophosphatase MutT (NUDIX family)
MILQDDQKVNVVVRAMIFRGDHLLVTRWRDVKKGATFLIGGRVDFGESIVDTLKREVREETGAEVTDYRLVYFSENIFNAEDGIEYHEYGWYFLVEVDREICGIDDVIDNPDSPALEIHYLKLGVDGLEDFWPAFMREYLPRDFADVFAGCPRYLYSREVDGGGVEVRELDGIF